MIEADLSWTDLSWTDLSWTDLRGADLGEADLRGAKLSGADLSRAKLGGAKLGGADLRNVYLIRAKLGGANLGGAKLGGANLRYADIILTDLSGVDLNGANLNGANLYGANLRYADISKANLIEATLSGANLRYADLSKANLIEANLSGTDLSKANLLEANLSGADLLEANLFGATLSGADLSKTQALGTDFTGAILTGSCIEDWNINSKTKLDGAICEYVYLKQNKQERRPHSGTFAPGDFAKLVQSSLETIDLIFREGLDWKAFAYAFKQIEVQYEDAQLAVQSIENKGDGMVIVKIATSPTADKEEIHSSFINGYEFASKALAAQYDARLQDKDKHINSLLLIVENLSGVTKAVAESKSGDIFNITAPGSQFASIGAKAESGGNINVTQNNNQGEKQSLAEAAAEIQRLLRQLEETNPTATESEQVSYVNVATKPELKKRVIAALKAGGETTIDEFVLENKFLKVGKSIIKAWLEGDS